MILQCSKSQTLSISANQKSPSGAFTGKYRKELIRKGEYHKSSNNQDFEITPLHLTHWVDTYKEMTKNGIKIPVPSTHEKAGNPDYNNGWITDMFVDGDSLIGICELTAPTEAELDKLAKVSDVSINSPEQFVDSKTQQVYKMPIDHVALCTDPVIQGLDSFFKIAASKGKDNMLDFGKLKTALKLSADITEENIADVLAKHIQASCDLAVAEFKKTIPNPPASPTDLTPVMLSLSRENRQLKLDQLVENAKITPAVSKALGEMFTSDNALQLSNKVGTFNDFNSLCDILAKNNPIELREKSGPQGLELSKDDGKNTAFDNPLTRNADARAKAAK